MDTIEAFQRWATPAAHRETGHGSEPKSAPKIQQTSSRTPMSAANQASPRFEAKNAPSPAAARGDSPPKTQKIANRSSLASRLEKALDSADASWGAAMRLAGEAGWREGQEDRSAWQGVMARLRSSLARREDHESAAGLIERLLANPEALAALGHQINQDSAVSASGGEKLQTLSWASLDAWAEKAKSRVCAEPSPVRRELLAAQADAVANAVAKKEAVDAEQAAGDWFMEEARSLRAIERLAARGARNRMSADWKRRVLLAWASQGNYDDLLEDEGLQSMRRAEQTLDLLEGAGLANPEDRVWLLGRMAESAPFFMGTCGCLGALRALIRKESSALAQGGLSERLEESCRLRMADASFPSLWQETCGELRARREAQSLAEETATSSGSSAIGSDGRTEGRSGGGRRL